MNIDVYATQSGVADKEIKDRVVVVVDVLRATSVVVTAINNRCRDIIPVIEIEEAVNMSKNYDREHVLLAGERNAQKTDGFDLSNSPLEYTEDVIEGKTIILTTTNGTRAIKKCGDARDILIGSMLNARAVADALTKVGGDVAIICAGTEGKFSLDDIMASGLIIHEVLNSNTDVKLNDLGLVCRELYNTYGNNIHDILKDTYHYNQLLKAGFKEDIDYCLKENVIDKVPRYMDGIIKL